MGGFSFVLLVVLFSLLVCCFEDSRSVWHNVLCSALLGLDVCHVLFYRHFPHRKHIVFQA